MNSTCSINSPVTENKLGNLSVRSKLKIFINTEYSSEGKKYDFKVLSTERVKLKVTFS